MARRIRWFPPGVRFYELITKCSGDEMLMRPDELAVWLIAQALSGALLKKKGVRILAFCFVSNHYHLIVMVDPGGSISSFMQSLNMSLASSLNAHRSRSGGFVKGRFDDTPILDEEHLLERLAYVHAQPVHHGLVARVEDWPGLSSFRAVCEGHDSVVIQRFDEEAWQDAGSDASEIAKFTKRVMIPLAPVPMWQGLSPAQARNARRAHERVVRDREREKAVERDAAGGRLRLREPGHHAKVDPFSRPVGPPKERKPKPWAHASLEDVSEYRRAYSSMLASYRVASAKFRRTGKLCPFPAGTRPPWIGEAFEVT